MLLTGLVRLLQSWIRHANAGLLFLAATAIVVASSSGATAAMQSPDSPNYMFSPAGNQVYVKIERYKRQGDLRDLIDAQPELRFGPETAIWEHRIRLGDDGTPTNIVTRVSSNDGQAVFSVESKDGTRYTFVNERTGERMDAGPMPRPQAASPSASPDWEGILQDQGYQLMREDTMNGRLVRVYGIRTGVPDALLQRRPGLIQLPVVDDLHPTELRVETYVDVLSGIVLGYKRYAIDVSGTETLIESSFIQTLRQEG